MARNITAHARYRLAAAGLAAAGGLWCLGAMFGHHTMPLLVIGMMNLAASMLLMSLRPLKGAVREEPRQTRERCSRDRQTAELTVRTLRASDRKLGPNGRKPGPSGPDLKLDRRPARPADTTLELMTDVGAPRPRERKNRTWSI